MTQWTDQTSKTNRLGNYATPPFRYIQKNTTPTFVISFVRGTRERSPPLPKIAHPSLPRLGRSQASTWPSAMHKSPPGGTACLITVSPMPGKLTASSHSAPYIPEQVHNRLWVLCWNARNSHNKHSTLPAVRSLVIMNIIIGNHNVH